MPYRYNVCGKDARSNSNRSRSFVKSQLVISGMSVERHPYRGVLDNLDCGSPETLARLRIQLDVA
jgi:hypothetical protein